MADKFIIHGATFNGDGTSSAEASSNGGVGAWNDINVFEGTAPAYGSIAAGDVVYIRSKDAGGADITRILGANVTVGSAAATVAAPVAWILDDGAVWPGVNGVLTYRTTATSTRAVIVRANNHLVAKTRGNFVVETLLASPGDGTYLVGTNEGSRVTGVKTVSTAVTNANPRLAHYRLSSGFSYVEDPILKVGLMSNGVDGLGSVFSANIVRCDAVIVNPDIELTSSTLFNQAVFDLAGGTSYPRTIEVRGGRVYGVGAQSGQRLITIGAGAGSAMFRLTAHGLQFPRSMDVVPNGYLGQVNCQAIIELIGCDDGGIGGHLEAGWGWATSRTDNNPPYLSATLPDTLSTPWAWRVWPRNASLALPVRLPCIKYWTGSEVPLTITQELLVGATLSANKINTWFTVEYTDAATGLPRSVSSVDYAGGDLDSSSAPWSATTWGLVSLNKRRIQVTTPTAVKQNTPLVVTFFSGMTAVNAEDIFFLDPDFSAVAA